MRIRIVQTPERSTVDGIDLQHFIPGREYVVGSSLGALFLAEGWAEPVDDGQPAALVPFSDDDPFMTRTLVSGDGPPNLKRETYPPYADDIALAADLERRKRDRSTDK
jgi:hypothetical protein